MGLREMKGAAQRSAILVGVAWIVLGSVLVEAQPRTIEFSDMEWTVRYSAGPTAPGDNTFSDDEEDVWIDDRGILHLTVGPHATEVRSRRPMGYGAYQATIVGPIGRLDPVVVFGFFTFERNSEHPHFREIDIEFSRWGTTHLPNAQFSVQPSSVLENRHRYTIGEATVATTHRFLWEPGRVTFLSWIGTEEFPPGENSVIASFVVDGEAVPDPGRARIYFNFWRYQGLPLTTTDRIELSITDFSYQPITE